MNKYAVLKFGGHALIQKEGLNNLINNIKYLIKNNYKVAIVHGGTPSVNEKLKEYNIKSEFINGYRVTTKEIMKVVEEAILGKEVLEIVKTLNKHELNTISLNGIDGHLIKCKKAILDENIDYGYVGEIVNINSTLLKTLLDNDIIPVISPIGCDDLGNSYNLNSDYLASTVALSIKADFLFMITNIDGIYKDLNDKNSRISILDEKIAKQLILDDIIKPTMATKVNACLEYSKKSNANSYIIDSNQKIDYDLFNTLNHGTKILGEKQDFEIRLAQKEDIKEILKIMQTSFHKYQDHIDYHIAPLSETYEDILKDLDNKWVFVLTKENKLIGTIRLKQMDFSLGRLSRLCVLDEYQKLGLGSILLKYAEKYASYKGFSKIGLTTLEDAEYLNKFYEKNNYIKYATGDKRGYTRALVVKDLGNNLNDIDPNLFL